MRIKAFFIYIGVGAAFLAASLWVFLSNGKSAKAIRTKYKLGGALLTAWAMLSASVCSGPGPFVTCYDTAAPNPPDPPEQPMCYDVAVMVNEVSLESTTVKRGENFRIRIAEPSADHFVAKLLDADSKLLQEATLQLEEGSNWDHFFKAARNLPTGTATLIVEAVNKDAQTGEDVPEVIFRNDAITIE